MIDVVKLIFPPFDHAPLEDSVPFKNTRTLEPLLVTAKWYHVFADIAGTVKLLALPAKNIRIVVVSKLKKSMPSVESDP